MGLGLRRYNDIATRFEVSARFKGAVVFVGASDSMKEGGLWWTLSECLQETNIFHRTVEVPQARISSDALREIQKRIRKAYIKELGLHPFPSVIAQGPGSLAVGDLLQSERDIVFKRVILFESMLGRDFCWQAVEDRVERVLNEVCPPTECSLGQWLDCCEGSACGRSGCDGFEDTAIVENLTHRSRGYLADELHYLRVWIPFLCEDRSVFLSYRRTDSSEVAAAIYELVVQGFGKKKVFRDTESIPPGYDFRNYCEARVAESFVMLVLIGGDWLSVQGQSGRPRLYEEEDPVRIEIEAALGREEIRVIPVLVGGASMPRRDDLPPSIRRLGDLNAITVDLDRFSEDLDGLVRVLYDVLAERGLRGGRGRGRMNESPCGHMLAL